MDELAFKYFQLSVSLTYKYRLPAVALFKQKVNSKQGCLKGEIQKLAVTPT